MTIDYKALAERLRKLQAGEAYEAADLIERMAQEKPAMWVQSNHLSWAGKQPFMARCAPTQLHPDFVPLFTRPAPQPQPERQPASEAHREAVLGAVARGWCHPENANKEMDATLAIAIADEVLAINRREPTEAQITNGEG